jgi:hypothetical protein
MGCPSPLIPTDIILAEGPLLRCPGCGQLGCLIHGIPLGIFSHSKDMGARQFFQSASELLNLPLQLSATVMTCGFFQCPLLYAF